MLIIGWIGVFLIFGIPALCVGGLMAAVRLPPHFALIVQIVLSAIAGYALSVTEAPNDNMYSHLVNVAMIYFFPLLVAQFIGFSIGFKIRNAPQPPSTE